MYIDEKYDKSTYSTLSDEFEMEMGGSRNQNNARKVDIRGTSMVPEKIKSQGRRMRVA